MNYSDLLVFRPKVKGLPGLEITSENKRQRRVRERGVKEYLARKGTSTDHPFTSSATAYVTLTLQSISGKENGRCRELGRFVGF